MESIAAMPIPGPLQQLWELFAQAPSHYQRLSMLCNPWKKPRPGANAVTPAVLWQAHFPSARNLPEPFCL